MIKDNFSTLCGIWNEIGPFNMDLFSDRLILQKKIFLLQQMGFDLDYPFGKYIRGPYSSQLAADSYKINAMEKIDGKNNLNNESLEKIKKLSDGHEKDALWFELIAFIVYLNKIEKKNKEGIINSIKKEKPHLFNCLVIDEAYQKLKSMNILAT